MLKLSLTATGLLDKSKLDAWARQKQAAIHKAVAAGMQSGGKPMADGPRYRMLGNSFAVPVIRWIGDRIEIAHGYSAVRAAA